MDYLAICCREELRKQTWIRNRPIGDEDRSNPRRENSRLTPLSSLHFSFVFSLPSSSHFSP
ncbi:hypothetical protein Lalb_Chr15g0082361 [Lupinus albus]|uniref:Uncharacterized protein n=1 Tax=Lupinus albus TaxID=3870 RepID=A0A6A4NYA8_LUPAL|nr:hypothetical protein Lalb_Chr15g0082361 [Lupinus albus]